MTWIQIRMEPYEKRILELLHRAPQEPGSSLPRGATNEEIEEFESSTGIQIPSDLRGWLQLSNGPCVGPGGLFGVGDRPDYLLISHHLQQEAGWRALGWLPIAGDGVGNYYVLDTTSGSCGSHPVYFLDHEVSLNEPEYVVASNLWQFLQFLLEEDIASGEGRKTHWPFNESEVLSRDPELADLQGKMPLPWERTH